jgi:H-type lectin domain
MSDLLPLSICSSLARFGSDDEGFVLHIVGDDDGERAFRARIDFASPFAGPPVVHVGISGFDIDNRDTARLRVHAEAISPTGFELVITTWRRTTVYSAETSWLAIGLPAG